MIAKLCAFFQSRDGATAIEYGLIAAAVSVAIAATVFTFGDELTQLFGNLGGLLSDANDQLEAGATTP